MTEVFYICDGAREVEEVSGTNAVVADYVWGGLYIDQAVQMRRGGGEFYYHANSLFSTAALTNSTGSVVERYQYNSIYGTTTVTDAVGTPKTAAQEIGNPWRFQGRRFDPESGLYHFRNRYLDPAQGRFVSRDPLGLWGDPGNLGSAYAYAGNDPVNKVDPSGLSDEEIRKIEREVLSGAEVSLEKLKRRLARQKQLPRSMQRYVKKLEEYQVIEGRQADFQRMRQEADRRAFKASGIMGRLKAKGKMKDYEQYKEIRKRAREAAKDHGKRVIELEEERRTALRGLQKAYENLPKKGKALVQSQPALGHKHLAITVLAAIGSLWAVNEACESWRAMKSLRKLVAAMKRRDWKTVERYSRSKGFRQAMKFDFVKLAKEAGVGGKRPAEKALLGDSDRFLDAVNRVARGILSKKRVK